MYIKTDTHMERMKVVCVCEKTMTKQYRIRNEETKKNKKKTNKQRQKIIKGREKKGRLMAAGDVFVGQIAILLQLQLFRKKLPKNEMSSDR